MSEREEASVSEAVQLARGTWRTTTLSLVRGGVFFAALVLIPLLGLEQWALNILVFVLMFAVMASAWNLVGGFAGYPSLGHAAFFGIGAYTLGLIFKGQTVTSGYEPFAWLPVVGVVAALIGVPIAVISMRTRADVFAIVTITLLFVVQTLAFNLRGITGGSQGMALPVAPFGAEDFAQPFYYILVALLAFALGLTYATMRSKVGLALSAVRADEDRARGIGVPVTAVKVLVFAVSVGLTAIVGAVWAYYETFIYPQFAVDPLISIAIVLMTFLGGRATLWGPVVGASILEGGQQYLAYTVGGAQFYLIAYALVFLATILLLRRGIVATLNDQVRLRRRRAASVRANTAPTASEVPGAEAAGAAVAEGARR